MLPEVVSTVMPETVRLENPGFHMEYHRNHYGTVAGMRMLSAIQTAESQKTLRIHSDNANVDCQPNDRFTENITNPQRECEFGVPAKLSNHRKHYGTSARMRILSASQTLE